MPYKIICFGFENFLYKKLDITASHMHPAVVFSYFYYYDYLEGLSVFKICLSGMS